MNENLTFKKIILKCFALVITFLSSVIVTRFVVEDIGSETYGYYLMSSDFVNYAMIISIALNSMAGRYITIAYYENDKKALNSYFNSVFFANCILSIGLSIPTVLLVLFLDNVIDIPINLIADVKLLFLMMFINFFVNITLSIFQMATFVKNRVDLDSLRTIESYIIRIVILIVSFKFFQPRIWYLGIATILSTVYVAAINCYYIKKLTPEIEPIKKIYFSIPHIIEVLKSGTWNSFTRIGAILLNGLDLIIANKSVSVMGMGVLSISKTIPKLILSALSNFAQVFTPQMTIAYAQKDEHKLVGTISTGIKSCGFLSIVIQSFIILYGNELYAVWVPNQNSNELYLLSIIAMFGYTFIMPYECLYTIFTITNKIKISSIYLFVEAVMVILGVIIGMHFVSDDFLKLCIIAGVSSLAETIRGLWFLPVFSAYCLNYKKSIFYKPLIRTIVAELVVVGLGFALPKTAQIGYFSLFCYALFVGFTSLIAWWLIVLEKYDRHVIIKRIYKGLKRT